MDDYILGSLNPSQLQKIASNIDEIVAVNEKSSAQADKDCGDRRNVSRKKKKTMGRQATKNVRLYSNIEKGMNKSDSEEDY